MKQRRYRINNTGLLLIIYVLSMSLQCLAQNAKSPISINTLEDCGFYMTRKKNVIGLMEIKNLSDSIVRIEGFSDIGSGQGYVSVSNITSDYKYFFKKKNIYIPPHQSVISKYNLDGYRVLYGETGNFEVKDDRGKRLVESKFKPGLLLEVYYWCGPTKGGRVNKDCKYVHDELINFKEVRSFDECLAEYLPEKNKKISLPDTKSIKVTSTDAYGFSFGYNFYRDQYGTPKSDTIPVEVYGYMKVKNTSGHAIKYCGSSRSLSGDTVEISLNRTLPDQQIEDWLLPPGRSVILRYSRKIDDKYRHDIREFLKDNKEFDAQLTFYAEGKSIDIPVKVLFEEKYFRAY